jgi:hypothetical protein
MTKTQRNIIVIAILIVSASLFWFIWANRKRKSSIANIQTSDVQVENGVIIENPTELDLTKLLKIGSQGEEVKELQRLINQRLDTSAYTLSYLVIDGDFGPLTENAAQSVYGVTELTLTDAIGYNNLFSGGAGGNW